MSWAFLPFTPKAWDGRGHRDLGSSLPLRWTGGTPRATGGQTGLPASPTLRHGGRRGCGTPRLKQRHPCHGSRSLSQVPLASPSPLPSWLGRPPGKSPPKPWTHRQDHAVLEVGELPVTLLAAVEAVLLINHLLAAVLGGAGLVHAVLLAQVHHRAHAAEVVGLQRQPGGRGVSGVPQRLRQGPILHPPRPVVPLC